MILAEWHDTKQDWRLALHRSADGPLFVWQSVGDTPDFLAAIANEEAKSIMYGYGPAMGDPVHLIANGFHAHHGGEISIADRLPSPKDAVF